VNASTLTLASVNITTPPAVETEKQLGSMMPAMEPASAVASAPTTASAPVVTSAPAIGSVNEQLLREGRPGVERFETAAMGAGAGLFNDGTQEKEEVKTERPPVERFETAREDFGMLKREKETV
jgi:N-methylhydantoinase B/oxoprolinase/acetone carboxylase alpha subunit